jgi:hypothetical protein
MSRSVAGFVVGVLVCASCGPRAATVAEKKTVHPAAHYRELPINTRWALVGDRLFGVRHAPPFWTSLTPLDAPPQFAPAPMIDALEIEDAFGRAGFVGLAIRVQATRYGARLLRSDDGGRTFHRDDIGDDDTTRPVTIGAEGFALAGSACDTCKSRVRRAGASQPEELDLGHGAFVAWGDARFRGDVVHLIGNSYFGEALHGTLDVRGAMVKATVLCQGCTAETIGFSGGDPLVVVVRDARAPEVLRVHDGAIAERWTTTLPPSAKPVALAEIHGLAVAPNAAWETHDGGRTWFVTTGPPSQARRLRCTEAGCLIDDSSLRVGWDR